MVPMIDHDTALLLRSLLTSRTIAALATMHQGLPAASMVPYAIHRSTSRDPLTTAAAGGADGDGDQQVLFVTHVSRLSAHTHDMLSTPDVCLLVMGPDPADGGGGMPQAVPRVSIGARARFLDREAPDHNAIRHSYLSRFPQTADFFAFGDFSLVAFAPTSARLVAGFARAQSLSATELARVLLGA